MIVKGISFFGVLSLLTVLVACNAAVRPRDEARAEAERIYLDYQATGDEDGGEVTVRLIFRSGGSEGDAVLLDTPSSVSMDGQLLLPDSSKMGGAFYEIIYPAKAFEGPHEVVFRDGSDIHKDTFDFPFFALSGSMPAAVSRAADLELELDGLGEKAPLHVMLTDTSFYGRGLDRVDTVIHGKLLFTRRDFSTLKNGPIHLELYREEERRLRKSVRVGGRLYLSYSLSREFELTD